MYQIFDTAAYLETLDQLKLTASEIRHVATHTINTAPTAEERATQGA